jgi:GntR family transcriptional regulator
MKTLSRYQQIINYYRSLIETGKLEEGQQIPTEEEMCIYFNVSRITIRRALDGLLQEGLIYKQQGKGSFVTNKRTGIQLNHLLGFNEEMRALGYNPSSVIISKKLVKPSELVAESLNLTNGQDVYIITRLRSADNNPMAIEQVHLPFHRFPGAELEDLSSSLYHVLEEKFGCQIDHAQQSIKAGLASESDASLLQINPGSPVLLINRITYEKLGNPFEYVQSVYRGDKYQFNVAIDKK